MALGIVPSVLVGYVVLRYNFLNCGCKELSFTRQWPFSYSLMI